jgi:hypothetical protein
MKAITSKEIFERPEGQWELRKRSFAAKLWTFPSMSGQFIDCPGQNDLGTRKNGFCLSRPNKYQACPYFVVPLWSGFFDKIQ